MNIQFHGGKEVVVTPTWVDAAGVGTSAPSGVTLVVQDNSTKVKNNGDGTWTLIPARSGTYIVTANFIVPVSNTAQVAKREAISSQTAFSVTVRA